MLRREMRRSIETKNLARRVANDMTKEAWSDPQRKQRTEQTTPLGRYGQPSDIAYGVLYLASDEASFVTGSELVIDGGVTAQ